MLDAATKTPAGNNIPALVVLCVETPWCSPLSRDGKGAVAKVGEWHNCSRPLGALPPEGVTVTPAIAAT